MNTPTIVILIVVILILLFLFWWWNRRNATEARSESYQASPFAKSASAEPSTPAGPAAHPPASHDSHGSAGGPAAVVEAPAPAKFEPPVTSAAPPAESTAPVVTAPPPVSAPPPVAPPPAMAMPEPMAAAPVAPPPAPEPQPEPIAAKAPAPAAKPTAPFDDLEAIEGIGPKISNVLKAAGVTTFAQLAGMKPEAIKQIITDGGVRIGDPATWPQQAKLAAEGKWDRLKTLQDKLQGGRKA